MRSRSENQPQPLPRSDSSPVSDPVYRVGYGRGYADAANEILALFENAFAGTMLIQYAREHVAEKLESLADEIERAESSDTAPHSN